ncbi:MAG: MBL fold metallo-hydrolase [Oscillospiraceae bacterium]|nr:MBL fold metallo-hydrolase [Oscillospiraceae bacterium]
MGIFSILAMKPAKSGEIFETGIYAIQNQRNCLYVIKASDGYIAIDAGSNANTAKKRLAEFEIGLPEVKSVFLTHSDYDHTAALAIFARAKIYMGEDEAQMIDGTAKRSPLLGYNALPGGMAPGSAGLVGDGQKLSLGDRAIECIKAPGHTPGSMAYLVDGKYLFTGDAFGLGSGGPQIHPFTMDKKTAGESIEKLGETMKGSEIVLTSHYGLYMPKNPK